MPSATSYAVVFTVALGTTFALTPLFRRLAIRLGLLVKPGARQVHTVAVPYLGGPAMLVGFLVALLVAWRLPAFETMFEGSSIPLGVALGAVVLCAVGTLDDIREVSAPAKTAGAVLGGSIMYLLGVSLLYFRIPFAETLLVLGPDLAPLVSVVWVVGMVNAVNFIDGLDGLAAGIVAIAAGSFFLYGHRLALPTIGVIGPDNPSPLIAVITAGLCLGFLPHNFNPARIFMGDGGALMLGGLMAASTMLVGGQTSEPFSGQVFFFFAPLFIPFFVMGVPIIDTAFAIVRRATKRTSVAVADKDHLHHRLMRLGHGQRRSVVIMWLWSALLSAFVLYPVYTRKGDAVVPFGVAALALVLLTWFHPGVRRHDDPDLLDAAVGGSSGAADANGSDAGGQPQNLAPSPASPGDEPATAAGRGPAG